MVKWVVIDTRVDARVVVTVVVLGMTKDPNERPIMAAIIIPETVDLFIRPSRWTTVGFSSSGGNDVGSLADSR